MKNAEQIKAEAKEQIKKLLDMCGCYRYTDKGIDKWLDKWEEACSPQIEAIAEKSPYYDGKCKVVFPSEYPREFNNKGVNEFCEWLYGYAKRNLTPVKINGFDMNEAQTFRTFSNYIERFMSSSFDMECLTDELKDFRARAKEIYNSEEFKTLRTRCEDAHYDFQNEIHTKYYNGNSYSKEDYAIINKIGRLADILSSSNARTQLLNEWLVDNLSYYFPNCKFAVGQKLSRAVNRIAAKYGFNKDPEWNREFAKYADAINPLSVTKWTVISWHPMDYLTFCFGNSWSTCSNIDKRNVRGVKISASRSSITSYVDEDYVFRGEHSAAALSYMFDKTSFIYYTVNHKYDGTHYEEQDKESRIVFSFNDEMDTLLQSRLYPQCNDDSSDDSNYRIPREIVQKVIADALGVPNLWKMKKGYEACTDYGISRGVHYPDYTDERNKNCNISWLGDVPHKIYIGNDAICPNCGRLHDYTGSLNCPHCDPDRNDDYDDDDYEFVEDDE